MRSTAWGSNSTNFAARASYRRAPQSPAPVSPREQASVVRAVSIPRYNRENSGYIEKYQSILSLFD